MWRMRGMAAQSARSLPLAQPLSLPLPLALRRGFSGRGAPSTAAVLRAMAAEAAELVAPLSRATATAPANKRTRLAALADPEAEAARAAFLLREEAAKQQREANAAKAAIIERARWERHHAVSAEESQRQTSRARVPIAREDLMRPHAAVSSAARPARPHRDADADGNDPTEALAAAAVRSALRPSFLDQPQRGSTRHHRAEQYHDDYDNGAHVDAPSHSYTHAPYQHQSHQHAAAAAARPPPRPHNSGASPFKQFDPFFDYAGALAETEAEAKARERMQKEKRAGAVQQRRLQRAAEAAEQEQSYRSLAERTAAAAATTAASAASAVAATPAQPAQRSAASRPSRPARPTSAPASATAPAAPLTETPHMRTGPLPAKSAQARYAAAMEQAGRWDSAGKKVPFVPPSAVRPLRASKVFQRDDAPANRAAAAALAAENGLAESPDAAAAAAAAEASAPPQRARGPGAPSTAVTRNKFPLDKHQQAEALRAKKEAAAAAAEEARVKKEEARAEAARKQRKKQAAAAAALMPDKDGKLPLQPADSPARPAPAVPAHPALYLRNFLAKIHPDLFHQSGATTSAGASGPASSEHMVQVNQDTVAKFNAIVDYYKHVKSVTNAWTVGRGQWGGRHEAARSQRTRN